MGHPVLAEKYKDLLFLLHLPAAINDNRKWVKLEGQVFVRTTGFLTQLRARLRDWAVGPVRADCYAWAALYFILSKTLYMGILSGYRMPHFRPYSTYTVRIPFSLVERTKN